MIPIIPIIKEVISPFSFSFSTKIPSSNAKTLKMKEITDSDINIVGNTLDIQVTGGV